MKNETRPALAQRLRRCAQIAGSGERLSQISAIPRRTLESYLSGQSEPNVSRLVALAEAVGVSVEWLATGEGEMMRDARDEPPAFDVGLPLPQHRGAASVDTALLKLCVEELEDHLDRKRLQLSATKKAEVISLLYEISIEEEKSLDDAKRDIPRMLMLVS